MPESITVSTSESKSYNFIVGNGLNNELRSFIKRYHKAKALVVVDEYVDELHHEHYLNDISDHFRDIEIFRVPRGEGSKSFEHYQSLIDFVLNAGIERKTPLFAIGGGVTGDLAGFVAATALRGIPLIHMPTTLLAMVDSSIGGKTGINHKTGKNLIGSFYQPEAVFADLNYLTTLDDKEWISGLSEILKYGFIKDQSLIEQVSDLTNENSFSNVDDWLSVILTSAMIKADIVKADTKEAGVRAYLNFGHTFAHAIEKNGKYGTYSHGEAVFAGMLAALQASNTAGANIDLSNLMRFMPLYAMNYSDMVDDVDVLIEYMRSDKKVDNEQINLVLLKEIGKPYIYPVQDTILIKNALNFIKEL